MMPGGAHMPECKDSHACAWWHQLGMGAWPLQEAASLNNKQWQQHEMTPCMASLNKKTMTTTTRWRHAHTIVQHLNYLYLFNQVLNKYIWHNIMISGFSRSHWYNLWLKLFTNLESYTYMQTWKCKLRFMATPWCLVEYTCVDRDLTPSTH